MDQDLLPDFRVIFNAMPGNFLVLQPDAPQFSILAISDDMLQITGKGRQEIIGKSIFDVFPENPELIADTGSSNLRKSLQNALRFKKHDEMPVERYDVPDATGAFEERYWSTSSRPVLDAAGHVTYIVLTTADITRQIRAEKTTIALQNIEKKYSLFMQAPVAVCIITGADNIVELANSEILNLWGRDSDIIGQPLFESIPEALEQGIPEILNQVKTTGESYYAKEYPTSFIVNGQKALKYYDFVCQPYFTNPTDKVPAGVFTVAHNTTEKVLARIKVEESAQELYNLANAMPQIVWIAEATGEVVYYNDRVSEFKGATRMPDGTWRWEGILFHEDRQPTVEAWNKAVAEGTVYEKEHRLQVKNGSYRWHLSRAFAQRDENGNIIKWYGTATDVHEQKVNEEALKRFKFMADQAKDPFILMREDGTFAYLNDLALERWGYTREEALFIRVPDIDPIYQDAEFRDIFLLAQREHVPPFETIHRKKDGTIYPVEVNLVGITLEGQPHLFAVARDMTEHKLAEETLRTRNDELQKINNDLDNFIYTASHDLKAPISNIEGLLAILSDDFSNVSLPSGEANYIMAMMQESVNRFKKTIASLTDVVKLQQENSKAAILVNVYDMIQEVRLDLGGMIKNAGAKLHIAVAEQAVIRFSEKNLRSVIYNLLSNAIKYCSPDREPHVLIQLENIHGYHVLIFKDNGLGIEADNTEEVFTMFRRFHDHVEGTGIGLYMVKKIVENAGGYIEVESKPGAGSTFKIYFRQ